MMEEYKDKWVNEYDWAAQENYFNTYVYSIPLGHSTD